MRKIVKVDVFKTWESCERTTYYVQLTTDEGFTITPSSFATGSVYTDHVGLSVEESRDRALATADEWADFLDIDVEPYFEDGVRHLSSFSLRTYSTQRELNRRESK